MQPTHCTNLKQRVEHILSEEIVPLLQMDGTSIEVIEVQDGIVQVRLHGSCTGCPGTIQTVIMSIEQELRQRVPEVEYLEAVP